MIKKKPRSLTRTIGYLILANLIAFAFMSIIMAYAQSEVIDDYINENNVQATYNVRRNNTLNCMELDQYIGAGSVPEDLTTYTEVEEGANNIKVISASEVWADNLPLNEEDYLYYDYGAEYFADGYRFNFTTKVTAHTSNGQGWFLVFANDINDMSGSPEWIGIRFRYKNAINNYTIITQHLNATANQWTTEDAIKDNKLYYMTVERTDVGNWWHLHIYTDALRTKLWQTKSIEIGDGEYFRYIYAVRSNDVALGSRFIDFYVYNLSRTDIGGLNYYATGIFYTTEIISTINGSTLVLLYNATIDAGDLEVQFSPNNNTWVDHNNVSTGWDDLILGFESIDLRDCNFTTLYMRFNFTRGGADQTPRLYQIRVITSGSPIAQGGISGYVVGILLLLPASMVLMVAWKRRKRR